MGLEWLQILTIMKRFFLLFLFLTVLICTTMLANNPKFVEPDFAYPQTVIKNAEQLLPKASGAARLRYVLEIIQAKKCIDPNYIYQAPSFVRQHATDAEKSLYLTLEAKILTDIYSDNRWQIDRRTDFDGPQPERIEMWSRKNFIDRIDTLLAEALILADATPLGAYKPAIEYSPEIIPYIPDAKAFVANTAVECLSEVNPAQTTFILRRLISESPEASAPWFYWQSCLIGDNDGEKLLELYTKYKDIESARWLLYKASDFNYWDDPKTRDQHISLLEASLKQYPKWWGNNTLKNCLNVLSKSELTLNSTRIAPVGSDFKVHIQARFCPAISLKVYKIPAERVALKDIEKSRVIEKINLTDLPADFDYEQTLILGEPGYYAVVPQLDKKCRVDINPLFFEARALDAFSFATNDVIAAVAVDFATGAPLNAVPLTATGKKNWNAPTQKILSTKTDADGIARLKPSSVSDYRDLSFNFDYKGHDTKFSNLAYTPYNGSQSDSTARLLVFSDRALYHHGDSIAWAVVVANRTGVIPKCKIEVTLLDENYDHVDSCIVKTDDFGRAYGSFTTPKDRLSGTWTVRAEAEGTSYSRPITVSDFKLPTWRSEIKSLSRAVDGSVTIQGQATTYAGMPVAGAKVDLTVMSSSFFRWAESRSKVAFIDTVTDAGGFFALTIPADKLKEYNFFEANITVTATDGSATTASRFFSTGKPLALNASVPSNVNSDSPLTFTPTAVNPDGEAKPIAITWSLHKYEADAEPLLSGHAMSSEEVKIDLSTLPADRYQITIAPVDSTLADSTTSNNFLLYSIRRNLIPKEAPALWLIESKDTEVLLGINADQLWVYSALSNDPTLSTLTVKKLARGFHSLNFTVPEGFDKAELKMTSILAGKKFEAKASLRKEQKRKAELIAESWRDRISTGDREEWRFRLSAPSEAPSAMIATMYNKALDALTPMAWPSQWGFSEKSFALSVNTRYGYDNSGSLEENIRSLKTLYLLLPQYRFIDSELVFEEKMMLYDSVKSTTRFKMGTGAVNELAAPSAAAQDEADDKDEDAKLDFRAPETLQCFWHPELVADRKGNIDIRFFVPNAIGAWTFRGFAWNKKSEAAAEMLEVMSNKPIMVQPNLPRFLRAGDKAVVVATVYNNSDKPVKAITTFEVFDPNTDKVIDAKSFTSHIDAMGSALVEMELDADPALEALGFRVRSKAGSFADGEQALIPILPSEATVIESERFYLNPTDGPLTLTVDTRDAISASLQYTQNPIWNAVQALRGVWSWSPSTANALSSSLFSLGAAKHIVESSPVVAEYIDSLRNSRSQLAENEDIKLVLLNQTPWNVAAKSETARIQALARFLDPKSTQALYSQQVKDLLDLRRKDGGFAWGPWCKESSVWSTENVLVSFGIAKSLGLSPALSADTLKDAYRYLEPQKYLDAQSFTLISALWPEFKPGKQGKALIDKGLQNIEKGWKNHSAVDKAYDIIILHAFGKDRLAREILESLRQYAVATPSQGMSFPSVDDMRSYATILQAYALMGATTAEIDAMRQWVLVQTEGTDDLTVFNPDYIIAALMQTGSDWNVSPEYIAQSLPLGKKSVDLKIRPNGKTPSFGSVTRILRQAPEDVKASTTDDMAIDKRFLVYTDGKWVPATSFSLGQRVRIQLIVTTTRELEYITVDDTRAALFEPVDQLPGYLYSDGAMLYRENRDASTRLFATYLPAGTHIFEYDVTVNNSGTFAGGIATIQSQLAPALTAHSPGSKITAL